MIKLDLNKVIWQKLHSSRTYMIYKESRNKIIFDVLLYYVLYKINLQGCLTNMQQGNISFGVHALLLFYRDHHD